MTGDRILSINLATVRQQFDLPQALQPVQNTALHTSHRGATK
jgi:hypothetical protein